MVALALVAGAGGAVYWAVQSSNDMEVTLSENAQVVASVDECVAVTSLPRVDCEEAAQRAMLDARQMTPLPSKEACEEKFGVGQCEVQPKNAADTAATQPNATGTTQTSGTGTGMWLPMMTGFLLRDALVRSGDNGARGFFSQPTFGGNTAAAGATAGAGAGAGATGTPRSFALGDGSRFQTDARGTAAVPVARSADTLARQQSSITSRAAPAMRGGFGSSARSSAS